MFSHRKKSGYKVVFTLAHDQFVEIEMSEKQKDGQEQTVELIKSQAVDGNCSDCC